ncbi:putative transcription factor bHLH family [Helianthus anomalus]
MDKATVLEDAANYIQELQNRVKELEGSSGTMRNNMQDSAITGKRFGLSNSVDDGSCSYEANFEESSSSCNPEIEVRTSECSLLVEIYSRKKRHIITESAKRDAKSWFICYQLQHPAIC